MSSDVSTLLMLPWKLYICLKQKEMLILKFKVIILFKSNILLTLETIKWKNIWKYNIDIINYNRKLYLVFYECMNRIIKSIQ